MKTNKCIDCGKLICNSSTRCRFCANKQQNNPAWKGGLDKEKYKEGFNKELRDRIRFRDRFTCQMCGLKQTTKKFKLDIHHIDYSKQNNSPHNLVSLCHSCHIQTNYDRDKWIEFFKKLFIYTLKILL